jgi:hypothetical protein
MLQLSQPNQVLWQPNQDTTLAAKLLCSSQYMLLMEQSEVALCCRPQY